ncbi:hypothetical protein LZF95_00850 [Algoriphagus sp. AGSA1]|uniref:hypothetical protein n=1 Tax=Algoriphagus sp. AGSA1 TaxID=2907213 RepID=UPI001F3118EE|nr:hypothetical protein [Algoriphagus sp. AGSA1]MCE7053202.1 hypothetical protein [Algoriphagus sp. AGSA1]
MKKLNAAGKAIVAIGILHLFRKIDTFYGFGGYVDNTWEILFISLTLITIGLAMLFFSIYRSCRWHSWRIHSDFPNLNFALLHSGRLPVVPLAQTLKSTFPAK